MDPAVYANMAAVQDRHWWYVGRRRILASEIARLTTPKGASILDAGCGPGANLAMLSQFGAVSGMELDPGARAHASAMGYDVVDGRLPGAPFDDASFDLVGAFDVIEHIEDDAGAVGDLARLLRPGGRLIATVPAHPWLWSAHDVKHHHFRRYREADFLHLFAAAGLVPIRRSHINAALFPAAAIVRLLRNAIQGQGKGKADDAMPPAPLNALLSAVFGAEASILRLSPLPFGLSLLVVAEKPA